MIEPLSLFWGVKTQAIFDVWTIEHVLSGISVGNIVFRQHHAYLTKWFGENHSKHSWRLDLTGVLLAAFAWETVEHYLETGLAGAAVEHWFQGVEMWANRIIADPLMLVLGYAIAKRYPATVLPARILSALWLLVHIFLFPHSMYLHELF